MTKPDASTRRPSGRSTPGFSRPGAPKRMSFIASHLEGDESAVDRVVAAGDERGGVGAEEQREVRDLVGAPHAADGLRARQRLEHLRLAARVAAREEAVDARRV